MKNVMTMNRIEIIEELRKHFPKQGLDDLLIENTAQLRGTLAFYASPDKDHEPRWNADLCDHDPEFEGFSIGFVPHRVIYDGEKDSFTLSVDPERCIFDKAGETVPLGDLSRFLENPVLFSSHGKQSLITKMMESIRSGKKAVRKSRRQSLRGC